MVEDHISLVLYEYIYFFIFHEIIPGVYTLKNLSEVVSRNSQLGFDGFSNSIDIEFNDVSIKSKLILRPEFFALRVDGKSFSNIVLGFNPHWDHKHYNEYISQKIINISTINKIHLKCDVFDGTVVLGKRQSILFSFVIDKPPGYKVFCEPETIHYKKNKQIYFEKSKTLSKN